MPKIRFYLPAPYKLDGSFIELTASIGRAAYRKDGKDCTELIKKADYVMYLANTYGEFQKRSFEPPEQN